MYRRIVAAFFVIANGCAFLYFSTQRTKVFLTLDLAASTPSVAQTYFDAGSGYRESDSRTARFSSHSPADFETLSFELPSDKKVRSLRFDPSMIEGTYVVRNVRVVSGSEVLASIQPEDLLPLNQLRERIQHGAEVSFVTTEGANDPYISLGLHKAIAPKGVMGVLKSRSFWLALLSIAGVSVSLVLLQTFLGWIGGHVGRLAVMLSNPEALPLDSAAIWFCAICVGLFILAVCLNLNGSSAGVYPAVYQRGAPANILLGTPKPVRADEWSYETPAILNQALRFDRFQLEESEFGPLGTALIGDIPVKHFSTLFRPQYWAFFALPADYAFAFYWQCKALLLLLGCFAWLLILTRSTFWSVTGALWYFFSPLTQWAYSWPAALPETIGLMLLTTTFASCLAVETRMAFLAVEALGFTVCAVDFALCAYVPHMIPIFWVGAIFFVAWCAAKREIIFRREFAIRRIVAFALSGLTVVAVGVLVFLDIRAAIEGIANTSYPGHRVANGGSMRWSVLMSSLMSWVQTENHIPPALGNICEGSGYLWLAPISLLLLRKTSLSRSQKWMMGSLVCAFAILLIWLLAPLPAWVGHAFALDRTLGQRIVPALGVANVAIAVSCASLALRSIAGPQLLVLVGLMPFAVMATNRDLGNFFSTRELVLSAIMAAILAYLLLTRRKWWFAAVLIIPQVWLFGLVNPVERGLSVYLDSDLRKFVVRNPGLLRGKWLVFSDSVASSGFLAATGAEVYTGMKYLPHVDDFPLFNKHGIRPDILNRGSYLDAHLRRAEEAAKVDVPVPIIVQWSVSPADGILKEIGIRYLAFDNEPDEDTLRFLRPLAQNSVDGFWLYELR